MAMSDSDNAQGDDYVVIDQAEDSGRRTRRGTKSRKSLADQASDSEDSFQTTATTRRYEEDDDFNVSSKKSKAKGKTESPKKKSKKRNKKDPDSEEEMEVEEFVEPEKAKSVPPLKIKIPPPQPKRTSGRVSKPRIDENVVEFDDEVLNESIGNSRSKSKQAAVAAPTPTPPAPTSSGASSAADDNSGPTRRSERIFVSHTKKVEPKDDEDDEEEFEIIHKDFCNSCRAGGDLILCDYCPRAYHKVCLDTEIDEIPDDWDCPHCAKNGRPDPKELREQQAKKMKKKQAAAAAVSSVKTIGGKNKQIENNDFCEVCNQLGELLLCDTCPRAYHLVCMDQDIEIPSGNWSCPYCREHGIEPPPDAAEEKPEKVEKIICKGCRQHGGEIMFCANCPARYHPHCVSPPLDEIPESWLCIACSVEPLKGKVQRIITWRWKKVEKNEKEKEKEKSTAEDETKNLLKNLSNRRPRERQFFIKWKDMSYWHCSWIDEAQLQVFHSGMFRSFASKYDMNNPPVFDETGATVNLDEHEPHSSDPNIDKHLEYHRKQLKHRRRKRCTNLPEEVEESYCRFGIKPEWLMIQRIINHRKMSKGGKLYYVIKWRDLPYEEVTVEEEPENCDYEFPEYQKKIDEYWNHRRLIEKETDEARRKEKQGKSKDKNKKSKGSSVKIDPKKKFDTQPEYIPEPFKLHPYQMEGLNWLRYSWASDIDTILADEMGLGKTVQTVTFLYSLYKEGHSKGPFLIAAPLSTIINWERELDDWCPDFYVVNYTGNKDSRIIIRENELSFDADVVRSTQKAMKIRKNIPVKFHVLLTSYELINGDSALLGSIDWKVLVVDEAHRLKSNQSLFFRTLRDYSVDHRLLLTGTPLQNNLEELFNLLNFLSPDTFTDQDGFLNEFADIAKEDQVKRLHELLGPHLLRRMKADVLEGMPTKSEFIIRVDLAPVQKKYYKWILTKNFTMLNQKGSGKQMSLLNVVMDLKKCCNHPYLFPGADEEAPKDRRGFYEVGPLVKACGKLVVLHKMLKKLKADNHRVLIFSQMTQMLDVLEDFLEGEGYKYERIDGSITGTVRQEAIDRFNAPGAQQFVFLLSTRAGGLGINLATADTVVIYDSDWNPHNDIQALSRAHRLGQTNKVMIYRFVTRNSVEERITQVAKKKMMLTHLVVRPGLGNAKQGASMSKQELDDILKFGTEELFKEEEGKEAEMIVYDDKAIDELLDRTQEGIEQKEMIANEYLSSFKVASYVTKETEEEVEEIEEEKAKDKKGTDQQMDDPQYWEKLLGTHFVSFQDGQHKTLGKGKRVRKQVNYMDPTGQSEYHNGESSGESSEFSAPSEISEDDGDFDERTDTRGQKQQRKNQKEKEKLPPLLNDVGTNVEILGFTPRQRRQFLSLVMRFGLPPIDVSISDTQFYVRELRSKPEKHLRAYTQMFINHLYEPGDENSKTYEDGVPKESLNTNLILARIGVISLIRRKVYEYQDKHGLVSFVPPPKPVVQIGDNHTTSGMSILAKPPTDAEAKPAENQVNSESAPAVAAEGETKPEGETSEEIKEVKQEDAEEEANAENEQPKKDEESQESSADNAQTDVEMKEESTNDETVETKESTDEVKKEVDEEPATKDEPEEKTEDVKEDIKEDVKEDVKEEVDEEVSEVEQVLEVRPFDFNIQDCQMTELHTLWYYEENELKPKCEQDIWNKRHDYWLLHGIVKHGYEMWDHISSDEDYAILNQPFKATLQALQKTFFERRLRLLEQALIFEEQLRRYSHLANQDVMVKKSSIPKTPPKSEENENGEEKVENDDDENNAMEVDEQDKEEKPKKEEISNENSDSPKNGPKSEDAEDVAEDDKENDSQDELILNPNIQRAANQMEDLFIDMKSDCARIPQTVQRIPAIAMRLQLNSQRSSLPRMM